MAVKLNSKGRAHAASLIASGKYDATSAWAGVWTTAKENSIWKDGAGKAEYAKLFLGIDTDKDPDTKGYYKYPYSNGEKVYLKGLNAAASRAGQAGAKAIETAAHNLAESIKAKEGEQSIVIADPNIFDVSSTRKLENGRTEQFLAAPLVAAPEQEQEDGVILGYIVTESPNRYNRIIKTQGIQLSEYYQNPIVLWMHNDSIPPPARNIGLTKTAQGLLAKTYFHRKTPLSIDLYNLYKGGDMFAFSIGFDALEDPTAETRNINGEDETIYTFGKINLLEYSLVNIPVDAGAIVTNQSFENRIRQAIQRGTIKSDSPSLPYLGLSTKIKTQSLPTMEKQSMSKEEIAKLKGHVQDQALHCTQAKDALTKDGEAHAGYLDAMDGMEETLEKHKQAMADNDMETVAQCHQAMHARLHDMKQAHLTHAHATQTHKDALKHGQRGLQGVNEVMQGYDAWNITDDVDAATEPFREDQNPGSQKAGDPANKVTFALDADGKAFIKQTIDAAVKQAVVKEDKKEEKKEDKPLVMTESDFAAMGITFSN